MSTIADVKLHCTHCRQKYVLADYDTATRPKRDCPGIVDGQPRHTLRLNGVAITQPRPKKEKEVQK